MVAACYGGEHCEDPDLVDGGLVSLICSNLNVLEAEVPEGSLIGASMSKVVHVEPLS